MPSAGANYGAPTACSESSSDDACAKCCFETAPLFCFSLLEKLILPGKWFPEEPAAVNYHSSTICTPGKYFAMISLAPLPFSAMA